MKFGKLPARLDHRTLKFADYRSTLLPQARPAASTLYRFNSAMNVTDANYSTLFPMDGNDAIGDCTCAAQAHLITLWNGIIGKTVIPAAVDVVANYRKLTGGPDTGLDCLTVLQDWRNNGLDGHKITAYMSIDTSDRSQVQQAVDLFGAVYTGFVCQENTLTDFRAGTPWTSGPTINEGHCVAVTSYSEQYVRVLTWGSTQLGTWDWFEKMVDECYVILPPEAQSAQFAPGFDYDQLKSDLAAL